jgi:hypothetical protein
VYRTTITGLEEGEGKGEETTARDVDQRTVNMLKFEEIITECY